MTEEQENKEKKVVIVVVAYNAVSTLASVLSRIPEEVLDLVSEICVFDDASDDETYAEGLRYKKAHGLDKLRIYRNQVNQGYGGNQKLAYRYAISKGYDVAVLLHGDGQYAPEVMMDLIAPILEDEADAVFGSRMMKPGSARQGGMPLYKYAGNRILSTFQNVLLNASLSEYHSGYRAYSLRALGRIPFDRNSDDFHFDTQTIIQLMAGGYRLKEVPIPTYYGDEICYVNGLRYAKDVVLSVLRYRMYTLGLADTPEYELQTEPVYPYRASPYSSHQRIAARIPPKSRVLDVGCGEGSLAAVLAANGCLVDGVDIRVGALARQHCHRVFEQDLDLADEAEAVAFASMFQGSRYDYVVLADLLEHLKHPERLLRGLAPLLGGGGRLLASTGNVAHWFIRMQLMAGDFRYTPRGILDRTHLKLYTRKTFLKLLLNTGFRPLETDVTVIPMEELSPVLAESRVVKGLDRIFYEAARLWPGLLAYQILAEAEARSDPLDSIRFQEERDDREEGTA